MRTVEGDSGASRARLIQRLGEARCGRESGLVGELNLLARTGLPVPGGLVLTQESHREFAEASGLLRDIRAATEGHQDIQQRASKAQLRYSSMPIEGELNRVICEELIELGASTVTVLSQDLSKSGLKSIPEVQAAVRQAWLSFEGLKRQIQATALGEELPTWPVLIQRDLYPEYIGWSEAQDPASEEAATRRSDRRSVGLYDVRSVGEVSSPEHESIAHLTLDAEHLLGEPVRLKWALKSGRWYILSVASSCRR